MKKEKSNISVVKANSTRNSICTSAYIKDLDFTDWFTDDSLGTLYLHVHHKDGETIHRVYCKHTQKPRLKLKDGVLYWIVDK